MDKQISLKSNKKNIKRIGRGISAGGGKTAGRGTKGQNSRAGHNIPKRYEGGQTPLSMRLPKLPGFSKARKINIVINLDQISKHYKNNEKVTPESLVEKGLIKKGEKAKILSGGELKVKVAIENVAISKKAASLVESFAVKASTKKPEKK